VKAFFLSFVVLILICSSGNKQKNDLEKENLKGNVKSLREASFNAVDNFSEITKGDRGGAGWFGPYEYYNKYNNKGFLTESVAKYFDGDSLILQEVCKYDDKGHEIEQYHSNSDGESGKETSKYDDIGNIIELNRYYPVDSLEASWKYTYKFDDKGNIIEENTYTNGSAEGRLVTYKYDEKDNLIEAKVYTTDSILHWKTTFKYDDKGNKIEKNMYSYDGSLSGKEIYKYDDRGHRIETSNSYQDGILHWKNTYKYDDNDNLIEETYLSDNGSSSQKIYKYEYDEKNNWIRQIQFRNDIPQYIIEREIAYYF